MFAERFGRLSMDPCGLVAVADRLVVGVALFSPGMQLRRLLSSQTNPIEEGSHCRLGLGLFTGDPRQTSFTRFQYLGRRLVCLLPLGELFDLLANRIGIVDRLETIGCQRLVDFV